MKDALGKMRTHCVTCGEDSCPEYYTRIGAPTCDCLMCNHTAAQHVLDSSKRKRDALSLNNSEDEQSQYATNVDSLPEGQLQNKRKRNDDKSDDDIFFI